LPTDFTQDVRVLLNGTAIKHRKLAIRFEHAGKLADGFRAPFFVGDIMNG
jgi:hypothetical protein